MFHGWDNFYLLIGSAAAALIGLLFVVATLNTGRDRSTALRGTSIYLTPVVFHFAVIVLLCALAMMPGLTAGVVATVIGAAGAVGATVAVSVAIRIRHVELPEPVHWTDFWYYGVLPCTLYLGLVAAGWWVGSQGHGAVHGLAVLLLALLLAAIRNAWDLVTWLAPSARDSGE